jgi:hypothetical protein
MFVTLVLTNGLAVQTMAAALGISLTLLFTCGLAHAAVKLTGLDGATDADTRFLSGLRTSQEHLASGLDPRSPSRVGCAERPEKADGPFRSKR